MERVIFLSYSRTDVGLMQAVKGAIFAAGLHVWTDEHLELGSPSWSSDIEVALDRSSGFVAVLTPAAKASIWVRREIHYALDRDLTVIPVLASGSHQDSIPLVLAGSQYVDIRDDRRDLDRLVATLVRRFPATRATGRAESREVLLSRLAGGLAAPMQEFAGLLRSLIHHRTYGSGSQEGTPRSPRSWNGRHR